MAYGSSSQWEPSSEYYRSIGGDQILKAFFLLWLAVLICSFTIIGVYVLILERRHKKKASLRMPDGLVFLDQ